MIELLVMTWLRAVKNSRIRKKWSPVDANIEMIKQMGESMHISDEAVRRCVNGFQATFPSKLHAERMLRKLAQRRLNLVRRIRRDMEAKSTETT